MYTTRNGKYILVLRQPGCDRAGLDEPGRGASAARWVVRGGGARGRARGARRVQVLKVRAEVLERGAGEERLREGRRHTSSCGRTRTRTEERCTQSREGW
jgi:hypothetical protein